MTSDHGVHEKGRGWPATLRAILPRSWTILRALEPTWRASGVWELSSGQLLGHGIQAVLWDVDGTLAGHERDEPDGRVGNALEILFREPGLQHAVLSNRPAGRLVGLGRRFPSVPVVQGFLGPAGLSFRVLRGGEAVSRGGEPVEVPPRDGSGIRMLRKPSAELVRFAMSVLGCRDPGRVLVVGDQYLTDVASANLAGALSVKVDTLLPQTFPPSVRALQFLDRVAYRIARLAARTSRSEHPAGAPEPGGGEAMERAASRGGGGA